MKTAPKEVRAVKSSGNVFADLQLPDPADALAKADLILEICRIVAERGLTQAKAAAVLGLDQPRVSDLMRGKIGRFSTDKLFQLLNALGRGIEIVVRPDRKPTVRTRVQIADITTARERAGAPSAVLSSQFNLHQEGLWSKLDQRPLA